MVVINFVDGTEETVETNLKMDESIIFDMDSQCFIITGINTKNIYPKDYVKSIHYICL